MQRVITTVALLLGGVRLFGASEVSIPSHVELCHGETVANVADFGSTERRDATFNKAATAIIDCAQSLGVTEIGVPYVTDAKIDQSSPPQAQITFCSVVPENLQPCDGFTLRNVPATRVLAAICNADSASSCKADLAATLKGAPWHMGAAELAKLQWRFAEATQSTDIATTVVEALTGRPIRIGVSDAPSVSGVTVRVLAVPSPVVSDASHENQ